MNKECILTLNLVFKSKDQMNNYFSILNESCSEKELENYYLIAYNEYERVKEG